MGKLELKFGGVAAFRDSRGRWGGIRESEWDFGEYNDEGVARDSAQITGNMQQWRGVGLRQRLWEFQDGNGDGGMIEGMTGIRLGGAVEFRDRVKGDGIS